MRVLLTGCNGLLGQNILATRPVAAKILGVDLNDHCFVEVEDFDYQKLNITDRQATKKTVLGFRPHWIVHTAGFTNVDASEIERERCWQANVVGTENLVYAAKKIDARFLHISTDYIFDGCDGPYDEEARPNPLGYYGKSKLASENVVRASGLENAIVRTIVMYGLGVNVRDNFVTWLIRKLKTAETVRIVDDQVGNTTLASELAEGLWVVIESGKTGVYNIAGAEILDRYSFAIKVANVFNLQKQLISVAKTENLQQLAPRPLKSGLLIDKAKRELQVNMSGAKEGLERFRRQLEAAKSELI